MEEKQYYKEKRISSSSLSYFEQSPLLFKKFLDSEIERESTRYLDRGIQIHMAILEPEEFKKNFTTVNFETPSSAQQKQFCEDYINLYDKDFEDQSSSKTEYDKLILLTAYKNNYKTAGKDEKILRDAKTLKNKLIKYIEYLQKRKTFKDILSWPDWQRISGLKEGIAKHKLAKELLMTDELDTRELHNELVIFWDDPIHNLPCKSMIDKLVIDHEKKEIILIDLKTANTFKKFRDRCREFNYFRQLAFYWNAITWWFLNELKKEIADYTKTTYIIALKTTDDPEVKVIKIDEPDLMDGWISMQSLIGEIAWHWENDKWDYSRAYYVGDGYDKI